MKLYGSGPMQHCGSAIAKTVASPSCTAAARPVRVDTKVHAEVISDLVGFTGLSSTEVLNRMRRLSASQNHEVEHAYFSPASASELGWWCARATNPSDDCTPWRSERAVVVPHSPRPPRRPRPSRLVRYRASTTYVFGNAIHLPPALVGTIGQADAPVSSIDRRHP